LLRAGAANGGCWLLLVGVAAAAAALAGNSSVAPMGRQKLLIRMANAKLN